MVEIFKNKSLKNKSPKNKLVEIFQSVHKKWFKPSLFYEKKKAILDEEEKSLERQLKHVIKTKEKLELEEVQKSFMFTRCGAIKKKDGRICFNKLNKRKGRYWVCGTHKNCNAKHILEMEFNDDEERNDMIASLKAIV